MTLQKKCSGSGGVVRTLLLYTTLGCHLCEQAKEILWPILAKHNIRLQEVEISDSEELMGKFATAIPVIQFSSSDQSLAWPFSVEQVDVFVQSN